MYQVDQHHKVLLSWAKYRETLALAPRLLTLDHHTDTSKPFRNLLHKTYSANSEEAQRTGKKWLSEIHYKNENSISVAVSRLSNDEHVVTAVQTDIISSALVIAHNAMDTDLVTYKEHKIICRNADRKPNSSKMLRSDCDQVLESHFLEENIAGFNSILQSGAEPLLEDAPYILDIDLDYFNTFASVTPKDPSTLQRLIKNAGLITIATEPDYVKSCSLDTGLTSDWILKKLKEQFFS